MRLTRVAAVLALVIAPVAVPAGAAEDAVVESTVVVQPLTVDLTFTRDHVSTEDRVWAHGLVTNHGSNLVTDITAALLFSGQVEIADGHTRHLGDLGPRQRARARWLVCPTEPGAYVGLVQVEGRGSGAIALVTESAGHLLLVGERSGPPRGPGCR